tara:strand:+ start:252 stop:830 length:579 start_codon:yes stop_codon:yes gene_type:complete
MEEFDQYDLKLKKNLNYIFDFKKFYLPISFIFPSFLYFPLFRNDFYIVFAFFTSMFIVTWNYPYLSRAAYTKPIYYEDLVEDNNSRITKKILYNIELSKKFKNRFTIFQQLILSFTLAMLVEYSMKFFTHQYNISEFLGLMGGMLSLYVKITRTVGRIMLNLLYKWKLKEKNKLLSKINIPVIENNTVNIDV